MMPVSRRRLKAATRMVLEISRAAARICTSAMNEGRDLEAVEDLEEPVQDRPLVLHLLDARLALEGGGDDVVLRRVGELDPERLRQGVGGDVVGDRGVLELLLEPLVRLLLGLVVDRVDLGQRPQVVLDLVALLLGDGAAGAGGGDGVRAAEEDATSTRSYQKSFIVSTWARTSRPAPNRASEIATVTMTATVMVRLRRRPMPTSDMTN